MFTFSRTRTLFFYVGVRVDNRMSFRIIFRNKTNTTITKLQISIIHKATGIHYGYTDFSHTWNSLSIPYNGTWLVNFNNVSPNTSYISYSRIYINGYLQRTYYYDPISSSYNYHEFWHTATYITRSMAEPYPAAYSLTFNPSNQYNLLVGQTYNVYFVTGETRDYPDSSKFYIEYFYANGSHITSNVENGYSTDDFYVKCASVYSQYTNWDSRYFQIRAKRPFNSNKNILVKMRSTGHSWSHNGSFQRYFYFRSKKYITYLEFGYHDVGFDNLQGEFLYWNGSTYTDSNTGFVVHDLYNYLSSTEQYKIIYTETMASEYLEIHHTLRETSGSLSGSNNFNVANWTNNDEINRSVIGVNNSIIKIPVSSIYSSSNINGSQLILECTNGSYEGTKTLLYEFHMKQRKIHKCVWKYKIPEGVSATYHLSLPLPENKPGKSTNYEPSEDTSDTQYIHVVYKGLAGNFQLSLDNEISSRTHDGIRDFNFSEAEVVYNTQELYKTSNTFDYSRNQDSTVPEGDISISNGVIQIHNPKALEVDSLGDPFKKVIFDVTNPDYDESKQIVMTFEKGTRDYNLDFDLALRGKNGQIIATTAQS